MATFETQKTVTIVNLACDKCQDGSMKYFMSHPRMDRHFHQCTNPKCAVKITVPYKLYPYVKD